MIPLNCPDEPGTKTTTSNKTTFSAVHLWISEIDKPSSRFRSSAAGDCGSLRLFRCVSVGVFARGRLRTWAPDCFTS